MGHHGSETASSAELLDEVLPRYAIISCAKDNDYGHPHEEAVDRINKYADYTFSTYKEGTIIFESDGKGLSVINTKGESLVELE
jgi:competence protein ComEC